MADREHIAPISRPDVERLAKWLADPNGSLRLGRATFEAEVGGGIWVRTKPWAGGER